MQQPGDPLLDAIFDRLASAGVPDEIAGLVLGAYAGAEELRATIDGNSPALPTPGTGGGTQTAPLFLESITVAGFRGIGPAASLRLRPHPGLTLVVGRNGSGKSSFAEAAELCLTGTSPRLSEQSSVFRDGLRNLHQGDPCQIQVSLRPDGESAPVKITRSWPGGDGQPDSATVTVSAGGQRHDDLAALGWGPALATYRPFLTAGDFGRLISARPSELFDALSPILGLDPLIEADKRLLAVRKDISDRVRQVKSDRESLRRQLADADDDRARTAAAILARRQPELDELDSVLAVAGNADGDPVAAACRRIATATMPDPVAVAAIADQLAAAASELAAVASSQSGSAERIADLLESALGFHAEHGDGPCPVCRAGHLDSRWRATASEALTTLRAEASAARTASQRRDTAMAAAHALWQPQATWPATSDLRLAEPALGAHATRLAQALDSWLAIEQAVAPVQVPDRLRAVYPALHDAFAAARQAAADWLQRRHDAWREPAAALHEWLTRARRAAGDEATLGAITSARDLLKTVTEDIRADRLAPFAKRSQQVWEQLRQESNVELSGMRLDGTFTRRRVVFPATVDGTAAQALAVMSHGELQALGLAVFLPRACADDSPFKFVLIDDPVHSMDPAKVDGLAQVLDDLAATRQVIVFTHDNRLPEAVRRQAIDATIWEVARRAGSVVELRKNLDPVNRYLDDARALASAVDLPEEVRWPVVAGFCRSAIEAACHQRIRAERLARGERHADVDALIESARTLTETMAIALYGSRADGGKVLAGLSNRFGRWAGDVFVACKETVHGKASMALDVMVADTQRLTGGLR